MYHQAAMLSQYWKLFGINLQVCMCYIVVIYTLGDDERFLISMIVYIYTCVLRTGPWSNINVYNITSEKNVFGYVSICIVSLNFINIIRVNKGNLFFLWKIPCKYYLFLVWEVCWFEIRKATGRRWRFWVY